MQEYGIMNILPRMNLCTYRNAHARFPHTIRVQLDALKGIYVINIIDKNLIHFYQWINVNLSRST